MLAIYGRWYTFLPPQWSTIPPPLTHPNAQGRPGRDPQDPRPRRPHRPRGSPKNHEGNRPHPRPHPKTGQTPHRGGPRRRQGHRQHRRPLGDGKKQESAERASWRGRVDLALLSVLRDGLLRRSEAHLLTWAEVEFRNNGTALLQLHRSKTDQEGEGVVLYIGKHAANALRAIRPAEELLETQAAGLRTIAPADRAQSHRRGKGRRPGRGLHRPLGPRGHGPGPGQHRHGAAGAHDRGKVEELQDASQVHRTPSGRPRRCRQILPGRRKLDCHESNARNHRYTE